VLANLLPLAISLLANLLGLGGIGERVREVVEAIRARIDQAIDSLINRVLVAFRGGTGTETQRAESPQSGTGGAHLSEPFSISGEDHTITANVEEHRVTLNISSRRQGLLFDILTQAMNEVQRHNERDPRNADVALLSSLRQARDEFRDEEMEHAYNAAGRPGVFQQFVEHRINLLITHLRTAFQNTHVRTLDRIFTDEALSGPRFLPTPLRGSRWIRPNLYERGRSWGNFRDNIVNRERRVIEQEVRDAQVNHNANAWSTLLSRHRIPENAQFDQFRPSDVAGVEYDLDHIHPVYQHWNSAGHNATDRNRNDFYFNENDLRVVTSVWNRGRESEQYVDYVELNFRSDLAEGGNPNAREILDGATAHRFLDGQGHPL